METWQLQEAKSKFSHLVDLAMKGTTQIVTKRGVEAVAIISISELAKLKKKRSKGSLVKLLMNGPKVDLDLSRSAEKVRDLDI